MISRFGLILLPNAHQCRTFPSLQDKNRSYHYRHAQARSLSETMEELSIGEASVPLCNCDVDGTKRQGTSWIRESVVIDAACDRALRSVYTALTTAELTNGASCTMATPLLVSAKQQPTGFSKDKQIPNSISKSSN